MKDREIITLISYMRFAAHTCIECGNIPAVSFNDSNDEFKISCCGYVVENAEWKVALEVWNDFVEEKISESNSTDNAAEMGKEKTPNGIIAPCPKCGKIPAIHYVSDTCDDEHVISCCGVSKCRDGYYATIEAWNDYNVEHQLKNPAERSQDKISEVVEHLRKILIAKNQNYGNSAFSSPVLLPHLKPEDALLVRMSDKVARLISLVSGEKDRVGESVKDTLLDLAGYCVLAVIAMEKEG